MIDEEKVRLVFEEALTTQEPAFEKFFLAKFMQLSITYTNEVCNVVLPVEPHLYNPQGSLHGGVLALAMDVSMGHLIHHAMGAGGSTIEMKIQYMRPATVGAVRLEGCFIKKGRNVSFLESRAFDETGKLVGMATSTWKMPAYG
ncbi:MULTISPECIES: PaaI family thioesterase [Halomonadaceae]|uniref:PaaI family thioesterase n=1 Tax=Halomonadaceae TaxID=28256 RepID=UPI0015996820|nr:MULTISPECIES: PaaI family thioesterase [Halomonas]QJQ95520.1 PaaI family thioesterase [Halomonas sp. PA5]